MGLSVRLLTLIIEPAILGGNTDEDSSFVPFTLQGLPRAEIDAEGLVEVGCPVAITSRSVFFVVVWGVH